MHLCTLMEYGRADTGRILLEEISYMFGTVCFNCWQSTWHELEARVIYNSRPCYIQLRYVSVWTKLHTVLIHRALEFNQRLVRHWVIFTQMMTCHYMNKHFPVHQITQLTHLVSWAIGYAEDLATCDVSEGSVCQLTSDVVLVQGLAVGMFTASWNIWCG